MIRLRSRVIKKLVKLCLVILLIMAPILVLMLIFTPFASKKISQRIAMNYKIPSNYSADDIAEIVKKMGKDPEFLFYYSALDKEKIVQATYEVYEIMNRSRDAELLKTEIDRLQKKTKSLAVMFYNLDYPEDFLEDPKKTPDLNKVMMDLLFSDFKLAVLGVCYKANYDEKFVLQWDQTSRLAAGKLRTMIKRMND